MVTQTTLAGPMIGLYGLGVLVAWLFGRKRDTASSRGGVPEPPGSARGQRRSGPSAPTTALSRRAWPAFSSTT